LSSAISNYNVGNSTIVAYEERTVLRLYALLTQEQNIPEALGQKHFVLSYETQKGNSPVVFPLQGWLHPLYPSTAGVELEDSWFPQSDARQWVAIEACKWAWPSMDSFHGWNLQH
jgi:hypothetical protein